MEKKETKKTNVLNKAVRIITLAPIMALVALLILLGVQPNVFGGWVNFALIVLFLTVFPLLAYPLQPFLKKYKGAGRDGQRKLAIIMAVIGYILGVIVALVTQAPKELLFIYLTYLISGILIAVFNKLLKIKASGHSCGVVGPIGWLYRFVGMQSLWGILVAIPVFISSIKMKRHTFSQLAWGAVLPVVAAAIAWIITR